MEKEVIELAEKMASMHAETFDILPGQKETYLAGVRAAIRWVNFLNVNEDDDLYNAMWSLQKFIESEE